MPSYQFSNKTIKVKSTPYVYIIVGAIGFITLGLGIYLFGSNYPLDQILFSFGIIFCSGALALFINTQYYKIYINEEPGFISILESTSKTITPFKIPISYYSSINIQPSVQNSSSSSNFEVHLFSNSGSSLFIKNFNTKEKALNFSTDLQKILKLDLQINHNPYLKSKIQQVEKQSARSIDLPPRSSLQKIVQNNVPLYKWKNKITPLFSIALLGVLYGFIHISYFVIRPDSNNSFAFYIISGFTAFLAFIITITSILNLLGSNYLQINESHVIYFKKFLGKKINVKKVKRQDLAVVKNSLDMKIGTISLLTKNGLEIMKDLGLHIENGKKPDFSMVSDLISLKDEIIEIDTSSLSMTEKFYIENMILANYSRK